ncbi:aromatic acid exporter family protein [Listeria seeligeri]|uniref:aromatic acid exporter family protein n=1 Tax=Listeria seeligeri TaxID=1640 RepID=UPI0022EA4464|nr:aromatic acid exporter family protein [Listeria seeligeri]
MRIGMRTVKTAIAATLAIILAEWLHLEYAVSAGIIAILSVQNTKKGSLQLAIQRIYSTVLALTIAAVFFLLIGYNAVSFGLYLLIFIPVAVRLRISDGIVVSSVLVSHILLEQSLTLFWFKNELLLMAVGAGIAILLNLYMPKREDELKRSQQKMEEIMRQILMEMAQGLRNQSAYHDEFGLLNQLKGTLDYAQENAARNLDNQFFASSHYYSQYVDMRFVQYRILTQMKRHLVAFYHSSEQSLALAEITEKTAKTLDEHNTAEDLVAEITTMVHDFRSSKLPATRQEFENRAILFQFMNDLRYLLEMKRDFYAEFGLQGKIKSQGAIKDD